MRSPSASASCSPSGSASCSPLDPAAIYDVMSSVIFAMNRCTNAFSFCQRAFSTASISLYCCSNVFNSCSDVPDEYCSAAMNSASEALEQCVKALSNLSSCNDAAAILFSTSEALKRSPVVTSSLTSFSSALASCSDALIDLFPNSGLGAAEFFGSETRFLEPLSVPEDCSKESSSTKSFKINFSLPEKQFGFYF